MGAAAGENVEAMSALMWTTSRCDPTRRWATATGLLRISDVNRVHLTAVLGVPVTAAALTDPILNIRAAAALCTWSVRSGRSCVAPWGG